MEEGSCWSSSGYVQISHLKETKAEQKDVGVGDTEHEDILTHRLAARRGRTAERAGALMFWGAETAREMLGTDLC